MSVIGTLTSGGAAKSAANLKTQSDQENQLRQVSRDFVGLFMSQMMKVMRDTIKPGSIGHGGQAEQTFQSMADDEYANLAAQSESYGLTDVVYRSLMKKNGVTSKAAQAMNAKAAAGAYARTEGTNNA